MPAKSYWWSGSILKQVNTVTNFQAKLPDHVTALGLTPAQVTAANALCDAFLGAFNVCDSARLKMKSMTQWRDIVWYGTPQGSDAPAVPVFPVFIATGYKRGVVPQFIALRDMIVALPGYTTDIGADLGIIGTESTKKPADEVQPEFKSVTASGHSITLTGSMQGFGALGVEYAKKGGDFKVVPINITNLPATFTIETTTPGQPETGQVRAFFVEKNAKYGNNSPSYDVTLS